MKSEVKKVRKYEAKNPEYAGYMRLLSGARAFINPSKGTKSYERTQNSDRYTADLKNLKNLIDKKLKTSK